jgi:hypothetical protein
MFLFFVLVNHFDMRRRVHSVKQNTFSLNTIPIYFRLKMLELRWKWGNYGLSNATWSYENILSFPILSYPILSFPVLSCPFISYPILSYTPIQSIHHVSRILDSEIELWKFPRSILLSVSISITLCWIGWVGIGNVIRMRMRMRIVFLNWILML